MSLAWVTFGAVVMFIIAIVSFQNYAPFWFLSRLKQSKKRRLRKQLREQQATVLKDLGHHQLYYMQDDEADERRQQGKQLWYWQQGQHLIVKLLTMYSRKVGGHVLLGHWVASQSQKMFYLRTRRILHYTTIMACYEKWMAFRIFCLLEWGDYEINKAHTGFRRCDGRMHRCLDWFDQHNDPLRAWHESSIRIIVHYLVDMLRGQPITVEEGLACLEDVQEAVCDDYS